MNFTFDAEKHLYTYNGRPVPSVTQALRATGISPDFSRVEPKVLEHRRALGSAVHKCLHYSQEGDLDPESIDAEVKPYLDAQQNFVKEHGFKVVTVEQPRVAMVNRLAFGMTPDVTGLLAGQPSLIDFKITEGSPHFSWGVQLSAYESGLPRPLIPPFRYRRYTVQLTDTGKYRLTEWGDPSDFDAFKWSLALTWWKINKGAEPWKEQ